MYKGLKKQDFLKISKKLDVGKSIGKLDVMPSKMPLSIRKELKQMKLGTESDDIFQSKLKKLERIQTELEVRHNMKRAEFENYLKKIDMIEQGRSSFGLAVRKRLEVLKDIKKRDSKLLF